jgi:predicted TIM-barrel fold metal-dependent hydrolase
LRKLRLTPSEYVRRHLKFTPFAGEPVGWMIEQAGRELFMFSTDYPHPEGGKDPLAKFEQAMETTGEAERARFYHDNMAELIYGAERDRATSATESASRTRSDTVESVGMTH